MILKVIHWLNFIWQSHKAFAPTHLERHNVNLVLKAFNELLPRDYLNIPHYQDTTDFITLIVTWWQIVNVKYACKGSRLNIIYQIPLTYDETGDNDLHS